MFCLGIGGTSLVCFLYFCFPMGKKIGLDTLNRELHYKSVLLIPLCKCYDQKYQIQKISHLSNIITNNVLTVNIEFCDGSKSKMIFEHGIGCGSTVENEIIPKIEMINAWIADMKQ